MRNAFRVLTSRPLLGHWRSKLAVAAAVLVAATIGVFALQHGSQQTAYALDDLPQRLLEIENVGTLRYRQGYDGSAGWRTDLTSVPTPGQLAGFTGDVAF